MYGKCWLEQWVSLGLGYTFPERQEWTKERTFCEHWAMFGPMLLCCLDREAAALSFEFLVFQALVAAARMHSAASADSAHCLGRTNQSNMLSHLNKHAFLPQQYMASCWDLAVRPKVKNQVKVKLMCRGLCILFHYFVTVVDTKLSCAFLFSY